MTARTRSRFEARARVLKALAHPSRLCMVDALSRGERCVCELARLVGSDVSTVSKHLDVLENAGLASSRKEGLWVHYRLTAPCVLKFLDCVESVLRAHAKSQLALVR